MSEIKVNSIKGVGASAAAISVDNTDGSCAVNNTQRQGKNLIHNGAMQIHQRGTVSTSNGTVTTSNVTAQQDLTDSFAEATGSSLTYQPPTGTTEIIYEYKFLLAENNSNDRYLAPYYIDIDGSEILESRSSRMGSAEYHDTVNVKYGFRVNTGGSNNATTGDRASLSSITIKTMIRRWASSYAAKIHHLQYYSGTSTVDITRRPYVGITAIGTPL